MIELKVKSIFGAAHHLDGYQGDCSEIHGHNFRVIVVFRFNDLNEIGISFDFRELKKEIDFFIKQLDHKYLNNLSQFKNNNPTSENIAIWIFKSLREKLAPQNIKVYSVTVEESENYSATYYGD